MRNLLIIMVLAVVAFAAFLFLGGSATGPLCTTDETLQAPSGRSVELCDVAYETQPSGDAWVIVRAVDPVLGQDGGSDNLGDHDWACQTWGLPALEKEPRPTRIIVQLMAEPFVRGEPAPGITQSIEAYSEENATCVWELL